MGLNLGNLIAKQKAEASEPKPLRESDSGKAPEGAHAEVVAEQSAPDSVPSAPEPAPAAPAASGVLKGLKLGGAKPVAGAAVPAARADSPKPAEDAVDAGKGIVPASPNPRREPAAGVSDSLAALAATEELGTTPHGRDSEAPVTIMPDLVDVQCPTRELPEGISMEGTEFVNQLNQIYDIVYDPELFGQFVRTIMQELQEHPEYIKLMAPEDSHVMIAGLRASMGLAQIKKESKKRGPSSTTTKAGSKRPTKVDELTSMLDGMEGMDFS